MINVSIIGVGSFAKALLEGVSYYKKHADDVVGLSHPFIGPYRVSDINFVSAFDVDTLKVGMYLHEAISMGLNVSFPIGETLPYDALVHKGPCIDSIIPELLIEESSAPISNITTILKETKTHVVINLLPSGSNLATEYYAQQVLLAGCHFINAIPTPLATLSKWQKKFRQQGLCLLGDDIKSQFGATMLNRLIIQALKQRGIQILSSHQHNKGGNLDHLNLIHRQKEKADSKKKTIQNYLSSDDGKVSVSFEYTGIPSSHKEVQITIEAAFFARTPMRIRAYIDDEISLNGAGIAIDAIRSAMVIGDTQSLSDVNKICPYLFKNPPKHLSDDKAYHTFERFLNNYK